MKSHSLLTVIEYQKMIAESVCPKPAGQELRSAFLLLSLSHGSPFFSVVSMFHAVSPFYFIFGLFSASVYFLLGIILRLR